MNGDFYEHAFKGFVESICSNCECYDKQMNCTVQKCEEVSCPTGKLINTTAKCCPVCEGDDSEMAPLDASPTEEHENLIKHKKHRHAHDSLSKH